MSAAALAGSRRADHRSGQRHRPLLRGSARRRPERPRPARCRCPRACRDGRRPQRGNRDGGGRCRRPAGARAGGRAARGAQGPPRSPRQLRRDPRARHLGRTSAGGLRARAASRPRRHRQHDPDDTSVAARGGRPGRQPRLHRRGARLARTRGLLGRQVRRRRVLGGDPTRAGARGDRADRRVSPAHRHAAAQPARDAAHPPARPAHPARGRGPEDAARRRAAPAARLRARDRAGLAALEGLAPPLLDWYGARFASAVVCGARLEGSSRRLGETEQGLRECRKSVTRSSGVLSALARSQEKILLATEQAPSVGTKSWGRRFTVTKYTPRSADYGKFNDGLTATLTKADPKNRIVAVDPQLIPYGSWVWVEDLGWFRAEDCGAAIKGFRLDLLAATEQEAMGFGKQQRFVIVVPAAA